MGDMGDDFNALRKYKQEKRASNRVTSADLLTKAGIPYEVRNGGAHLILKVEDYFIDFWPGTGKWATRGFRFSLVGRGVHGLIRHIKESSNAS